MDSGASRIEQFNQAVRSIVTLVLTGGFLYGFCWADKINPEVFGTVFAGVIGYWFASRDAKSRASDQPTITTRTPDTTVVTGPTPPVSG